MKVRLPLLALIAAAFLAISGVSAQEDSGTVPYTYLHKGKPVSLFASSRLIAVQQDGANLSGFATQHQLAQDPLSERHELKRHGLKLYRASGAAAAGNRALKAGTLAAATSAPVQPVFEQGGAILIPTDEVIVGFKSDTSLAQAEGRLAAVADTLGIVGLKPHRRNIFIATISDPANARAFLVAQGVAALEQVSFCEPNFITLHLTGDSSKLQYDKSPARMAFVTAQQGEGPAAFSATAPGAPNWTLLAELGFETDALPQGWGSGYVPGKAIAYWGPTTYRHHGGTRSLYCTAKGSQGVAAPGPATASSYAAIWSPQLDLSPYKEVYLELWFYAKNDQSISGSQVVLNDAAAVVVFNDNAPTADGAASILAIAYDGDCTKDPTASNGWRRLLFRVPPSFLSSKAHFEVRFFSNATNRTEGTYIDDLRIVATTNPDAATLSSDRYSGRQYELRNVGQVAGLASERSDLHIPEAWDLVRVSPDIVVAVIDGGVELSHPDLNLVTGYDYDGSVGGQPRSENGEPRGSHGTNCAGNVGAIKDNGIGVVGTAPGVKIMPIYAGSTTADAANAIDVAVRHGAKVLSNSWGWTGAPSADIEDAVQAALAAGRSVLFAAGNGPDRPPWTYDVAFPARLTETTDVICVGASSPNDEHKSAASSDGQFGWGSSYVGPGPDVVAPGPWSYTTDLIGTEGENNGSEFSPSDQDAGSYTAGFSGTSSSTPKVAGIVALMLSKNPNLTPSQVKALLMSSADDIDVPGPDDKTGAGRVNAFRAVMAVPGPGPAPGPAVTATFPPAGATLVPPGAAVSVTFSEAMDPASITSSTFTLSGGVSGAVSYNSSTATATFTPSAPLAGGVTYTASIGTGARSSGGVALPAPLTWTFTTSTSGSGNLIVNGDFETASTGWTSSGTAATVVSRTGGGHNGSNGYFQGGNSNSVNTATYQDVSIPASVSRASLSFWYKVSTSDIGAFPFDTLKVLLKNPANGTVLQTLKTLSNATPSSAWQQSEEYDLTRFAGQQLRLEFDVSTDGSLATTFQVDDVALVVPSTPQTAYPVYVRNADGTVAMQGSAGEVPVCSQAGLGKMVAEGDFNGDGIRDFVWWNGATGEVNLQLMRDAQTSQSLTLIYREPDTSWRIVAAGDIDGDAKSDLIWHNQNTGTVYAMLMNGAVKGDGAVVLTEPDTAWKIVAATDTSSDGKSDLIWWHAVTGQVAVTLMNGLAPSTREIMYQEPDTSWRIVGAADLNGDNKGDLIWRNRIGGQVYAMALDGQRVAGGAMLYSEPDLNWEIASVGRYGGDDRVDLLWHNTADGRIYVMPLQGLSVAPGFQLPGGTNAGSEVLGQQQRQDETYGEGSTTAHREAGQIAWFNTSSGALYDMLIGGPSVTGGAQVYREQDLNWRIVGHGDFNGDGVTDSVWRNEKTGQVLLQYMKSPLEVKGGFLLYQEPNTDWRIVATGDVNGDARTDLIWWNGRTGQAYAMLISENRIIGGSTVATIADTNWKIVSVADVDGNGKSDLIWWNTASGQVAISRIFSVGPAETPVVYTEPDTNWRIAGAGDVNADGKADLIWHNRASGQVYAMLLNASGIAGGALIYTEPDTAWEIVSVGNYDNDGKADLLWWNRSTGSVYLMPLDGLRVAPGHNLYREPDTNWRIQGDTEWRDRAYGVGVTTTSR